MSKGKRYPEEFKHEAVKQVVERGYSVAEVAERLGICTKTLYQWRSSIHGIYLIKLHFNSFRSLKNQDISDLCFLLVSQFT